MRILATTLLTLPLMAAGCEKNDPLFCQMNPGASGCPDASVNMHDGGPDADIDADPTIDARLGYGTGAYGIMLTSPASGNLNFTGTPISTSGGNPCLGGQVWTSNTQPDACFVVANNITISADLRVTGTRPLVLVATNKVTISATLDVAGHVAATPPAGPGAPFANCTPATGTLQTSSGGGDGGAGASFMTMGGNGGAGDGTSGAGVAANADATNPLKLRAGCTGQSGVAGGSGGAGGPGGGAVYIVAGNEIDIASGVINASGGGGAAPGGKGGGGGGGTGGMIVLYAPTITTGNGTRVVANGGGGSGGGPSGMVGGEADPLNPSTPPSGGTGNCTSSSGGSGYGGSQANPGSNAVGGCGGGGGGGGGGYIQSNVALASGMFSPTPMIGP